jgi:hypothetical protein
MAADVEQAGFEVVFDVVDSLAPGVAIDHEAWPGLRFWAQGKTKN